MGKLKKQSELSKKAEQLKAQAAPPPPAVPSSSPLPAKPDTNAQLKAALGKEKKNDDAPRRFNVLDPGTW